MWGNKKDAISFLQWLKDYPAKRKVCCPGNHDTFAQEETNRFKAMFTSAGADYLIGEGVEVEGFKIWGFPWQPTYGGWAFNVDSPSHKMRDLVSRIPDDTEILISHGPPIGILDRAYDKKVGCQHLYDRVMQLHNLRLHSFGHIHCSHGMEEKGGTLFLNSALAGPNYQIVNKPYVIELTKDSKEITIYGEVIKEAPLPPLIAE